MTPGTPAPLRVFAALELPPAWADRLAEVITHLKTSLPISPVRWGRAEGMHLTLKFYGDIAPDTLPALQAALRSAAASLSPVPLKIEGLGVFPDLMHPRVIWVGVAGDLERLHRLHKAVEAASTALGFRSEARGFTPHLTLGRVKGHLKPAERRKLAEAIKNIPPDPLGSFTAETLSLMRSDLRPTGAVYTCLLAAPLSGRNT